jgi:hypothetical protein
MRAIAWPVKRNRDSRILLCIEPVRSLGPRKLPLCLNGLIPSPRPASSRRLSIAAPAAGTSIVVEAIRHVFQKPVDHAHGGRKDVPLLPDFDGIGDATRRGFSIHQPGHGSNLGRQWRPNETRMNRNNVNAAASQLTSNSFKIRRQGSFRRAICGAPGKPPSRRHRAHAHQLSCVLVF